MWLMEYLYVKSSGLDGICNNSNKKKTEKLVADVKMMMILKTNTVAVKYTCSQFEAC